MACFAKERHERVTYGAAHHTALNIAFTNLPFHHLAT